MAAHRRLIVDPQIPPAYVSLFGVIKKYNGLITGEVLEEVIQYNLGSPQKVSRSMEVWFPSSAVASKFTTQLRLSPGVRKFLYESLVVVLRDTQEVRGQAGYLDLGRGVIYHAQGLEDLWTTGAPSPGEKGVLEMTQIPAEEWKVSKGELVRGVQDHVNQILDWYSGDPRVGVACQDLLTLVQKFQEEGK